MTQPELRRTVLVGLGGAGQLILTYLKRRLLDTFNVVPPCIKFLALDTDSAQEKLRLNTREEECKLDPQEFLHLGVSQAREFVERDPTVRSWYIGPVTVAALENGAGAIRQNGRMALFCHIVEVRHRIENLVTQLTALQLPDLMRTADTDMGATTPFTLSEKKPEIYICGSLAGGTGSGTFLDIAILFRNLMPTALIHGFFLLDWVYRNKPFAHRVRGNVYAALAELDYLQSVTYGTPGFVPYTTKYADRTITVKDPPYSLFHVIDGRNEGGQSIDDVRALCDTVANAVFLSVGAMNYPLASVTDNLLTHIDTNSPKVWEGRNARYSSFGVSVICYPALELQRLLTAQNALDLCRAAMADVEGGMLAGTAIPDAKQIQDAVRAFFTNARIARDVIPGQLCPHTGVITFQLMDHEIANTALLQPRADGDERALEADLAAMFNNAGPEFIAKSSDALRVELNRLERKAELSTAYRRQWVDEAIQMLREMDHEAATQLNEATGQVNDHRARCEGLLDKTKKSRYIPVVGGPRRSAAMRWASGVADLLKVVKRKITLEYERQYYDALLKLLEEQRPATVPTTAQATDALRKAAQQLAHRTALEDRNLRQLKTTPTVTLVGDGDVVIVPLEKDPFCSRDSVRLSYEDFKAANGIHTIDDCLRKDREHPRKLAGLFLDHCQAKLEDLTSVSVHRAIEVIGNHRGDTQGYTARLLDDLFRKSAALWRFHRSRISSLQTLQYDNVVSIGVDDPEAAERVYGSMAAAIQAKRHIRSKHAFSVGGDPWRIWMLNYAAALPVYFLQDLEESREQYQEEITPTYHIDPVFEMNVPDLFPVNEIQNRALRVLGMAIVNGIDVIRDDKLIKGHKFTCDLDTVKAKNFWRPREWLLFRDMLRDIKEYNEKATDNLLDLLEAVLRGRVASMPLDQLTKFIQDHIKKFEEKLAARDFSRLISARLTYRETKELKDFLKPEGYAMDIDRYIAGR